MSVRNLKQFLAEKSKDELIKLLAELYTKHKNVKEYLEHLAAPDPAGTLQKYKDRVQKAFIPSSTFKFKLSDARKAIADFRKLDPSPEDLAEILLYHVEMCVEFTNDYGDIDEQFYTSTENQFENAMKIMHKHNLLDKFQARCEAVCTDTEGIGWGFPDALSDLYLDYFGVVPKK